MSDTTEHSYIVYQGYAEQWRWRQVDAEGNTIFEDGTTEPGTKGNEKEPVHSNIWFHDADSAQADLLRHDADAVYETKRAANFAETIDDAEEREDLEKEQSNG